MGELITIIFNQFPFFWEKRKTRFGLFTLFVILFFILFILIISFLDKIIGVDIYWYFVIPIIYFIAFIWWLLSSGRFVLPNERFTVVLTLKSQNTGGVKYVNDSIEKLKNEIKKISLKRKIRIIIAGDDIIKDKDDAHFYRERFDIDLVIWGTVFSGNIEEKEVFDFKDLFFTYKVPPPILQNNLSNIFKGDITLSLINRDWNLYEINSLPGIEKIGSHLSEIIRFIIGVIYSNYREFVEDSIILLESLFSELDKKTKNEKIITNTGKKTISISHPMFFKGRLLSILITVYKNIGIDFVGLDEYKKGRYFLEKYYECAKQS